MSVESPLKAATTVASIDAVIGFVEQVGIVLFGTDPDIMDRGIRTPQAEDAVNRFINEVDISALEVYFREGEGSFLQLTF